MKTKAKIKSSSLITCYVIAYDIPDDKRCTKVHKVLSDLESERNTRSSNVS